jgi:hypothetical protein
MYQNITQDTHIPAGILENGTLDWIGHQCPVVALTDVRAKNLVLVRELTELRVHLTFTYTLRVNPVFAT